MVKVLGKLSLIDISIGVFDETFAMFLGVLPLALIIISRNKVVLSQAIQLVIDPASWILIPAFPGVLPLSMFGLILIELPFVNIPILIFDSVFILPQLLELGLHPDIQYILTSYLEFIIDPLADLQSAVCPCKGAWTLSFAPFERAFKDISVVVFVGAFTV